MEKVIAKKSFVQGEEDQLDYWLSLTPQERFRQAKIWNDQIWRYLTGGKSDARMDKTAGGFKLKSQTDEDDF